VEKPTGEEQVKVARIGVVWDASKSRDKNPNAELEYKALTEVSRKVRNRLRVGLNAY
jgi:hypothetical protein